jgi:hypothetical protein
MPPMPERWWKKRRMTLKNACTFAKTNPGPIGRPRGKEPSDIWRMYFTHGLSAPTFDTVPTAGERMPANVSTRLFETADTSVRATAPKLAVCRAMSG